MKSPTGEAIAEGDVTIDTGFNFGTTTGTVKVAKVDIKTQKADGWSNLTKENQQDFAMPADGGVVIDNATVTFTYKNGVIETTTYAAGA